MDQNAKQLVAEKLRNSGSVLVAVSKNPSVDQLASAIGLSLMLNALGKHTTAVFSGEIPNTMEFLQPEKLIDESVDGLRDFIISISKDKADKLRYKVEDDVVKIFITPYQGKIDENDLEFSQGDFNVDAVVALGVSGQDDLDSAISSHGRILHDATILTISAGQTSNLGSINWSDPNASSISEMLVSISEALQGNLLDGEMATAFLTGIVAATDRFSNNKTTPKVMTMAAQLMAAGANQQLIAQNLELEGVVHENEEVDFHKDEDNQSSGKPAPNEPKGPTLEQVEEVATDDKLKLAEIEQKLHAHEDELTKHDQLKPDSTPKPAGSDSGAAHYNGPHDPEDPAIIALEDQIDHDPMENFHQIEEVLHQNSDRGVAQSHQPASQPQPYVPMTPSTPTQQPPSIPAPPSQPVQPPTVPPPQQQPQQPPPEIRTDHGSRLPDGSQTEGQVADGFVDIPNQPQQPPDNNHDPLASRQPQRLYADGSMEEPALQYKNDIPTLEHKNPLINNVKGQGPKTPVGDPSMGGTFNATSEEAHREAEAQMASKQNNSILAHHNEGDQAQAMPEVSQPQSEDMINQARRAVEAAMQSAPPQTEVEAVIHPSPQPSPSTDYDQINIDPNSGQFIQQAPPPSPPPLPPNPQMPPSAPLTANGNTPAPPPLPSSPNNVGQMYIPPAQSQPPHTPDHATENPFNLPGPGAPYQ